jgi:hypothetical protein
LSALPKKKWSQGLSGRSIVSFFLLWKPSLAYYASSFDETRQNQKSKKIGFFRVLISDTSIETSSGEFEMVNGRFFGKKFIGAHMALARLLTPEHFAELARIELGFPREPKQWSANRERREF